MLKRAAPSKPPKERGVFLGVNEYEGIETAVWLSDQTQLNHRHVMGGTGSGK